MGWLQHRKHREIEIDEHDEPTEPMPVAHPPSYATTIASQAMPIDALPTGKLPIYPQAQQQIFLPTAPGPFPGATTERAEEMFSADLTSRNPTGAIQQPWSTPGGPSATSGITSPRGTAPLPAWGNAQAGTGAGVQVYPVLPPAPVFKESALPPGSTSHRFIPSAASQGKVQRRLERRFALALLGWLFVLTQCLLLVRFILLYFTLPWQSTRTAVSIIVVLSNACMLPFQPLIQRISLPAPIDPSLYLLAAILIYGLLGRIVMPILRRVLRVR